MARRRWFQRASDDAPSQSYRELQFEPQTQLLTDPDRFGILFVCTGNIHRSAMAERLLQSRVDPEVPVTVISAGIRGVAGAPIGEYSQIALEELGADPDGHRARVFVPQLAARAGLVLTAESGHRKRVLSEVPSALKRTFTMTEFVGLAEVLDPTDPLTPPTLDDLTARVAELADVRRAVRTTAWPDVPDPVGRSLDETRDCARQISDIVDVVVHTLGIGAPAEGRHQAS